MSRIGTLGVHLTRHKHLSKDIFDDIATALKFNDQSVKQAVSNIHELKDKLPEAMQKFLAFFNGCDRTLQGYEGLIAAQQYQIVQQPRHGRGSQLLNDRRGDLLLLINGMPVIHIGLKKSGVPVSQAYNQIQKYSREGIFTGIFSLVQIFVAMEPSEALYFANPGPEGKFNKDYTFHWADFNNEPINDWKRFTYNLLSIPMAHQLIGFYTVRRYKGPFFVADIGGVGFAVRHS